MSQKEMQKALGKLFRTRIAIVELFDWFPNEECARGWFDDLCWSDRVREYPHCYSTRTREVKNARRLPYLCSDCKKFFSPKIGSIMHGSRISYQKWAIEIYFYVAKLKGVSSLKLHSIRQSSEEASNSFNGTVEVDEAFVGGREKNMHRGKKLSTGRGTTGKTTVVGVKERESKKVKAQVVEDTERRTLYGFIGRSVGLGATVNTDDLMSCRKRCYFNNEFVKHGVGEYESEQIHINGMESFRGMLKRAYKGMKSKKHLGRYVNEFVVRHNIHEFDTIEQMWCIFGIWTASDRSTAI